MSQQVACRHTIPHACKQSHACTCMQAIPCMHKHANNPMHAFLRIHKHRLGFFVWGGRLYAKIDCVQSMQSFICQFLSIIHQCPKISKGRILLLELCSNVKTFFFSFFFWGGGASPLHPPPPVDETLIQNLIHYL